MSVEQVRLGAAGSTRAGERERRSYLSWPFGYTFSWACSHGFLGRSWRGALAWKGAR